MNTSAERVPNSVSLLILTGSGCTIDQIKLHVQILSRMSLEYKLVSVRFDYGLSHNK